MCSKFGVLMFEVFDVRNFGVRSKTTSLGTNSSMFANCSSFGDVREVRSSVFGHNHMFGHV